MRYKLLEHTADAMVEAYGETLGERFANAAYAMFDQITDVTKIEPLGELKIVLKAENMEQLLVDFLQELLFGPLARRVWLPCILTFRPKKVEKR